MAFEAPAMCKPKELRLHGQTGKRFLRAWLLSSCCLFLCLVFETLSRAAPQSQAEAVAAIRGWRTTSPRVFGLPIGAPSAASTCFMGGKALFHTISIDHGGYVICAADDSLEPIVAFSGAGTFEPNPNNPLFALLRVDLAERLEQIATRTVMGERAAVSARNKWDVLQDAQSDFQTRKRAATSTADDIRVAPLIQSRWNQGAIWDGANSVACYNYYTPPYVAGDAANYPCGCESTAWAQIMRYFRYPVLGVGNAAFLISVDGNDIAARLRGGDGAGGAYDWDSMPLVPGNGATTAERQAIGALTWDLGVASGTRYAASGSSAFLSADRLKGVFHYSNAIYGTDYNASFSHAVLPNLDAGLPVYLGISGDGNHAVVCDGYGYNAGSLYHHLNLGWGGSSDAWYNLPDIGTGYHFTSIQAYVYNIYTNGAGEIISGRAITEVGAAIAGVEVRAVGAGRTFVAVTNDRGIYALPGLPSATTYTVTAAKDGFQFTERLVTVPRSGPFGMVGNKWGVDLAGARRSVGAAMFNPVRQSDAFLVSIATVSGKRYCLEHKDSFLETAWISMPDILGDGRTNTLIDPAPPGRQRFYRVREY